MVLHGQKNPVDYALFLSRVESQPEFRFRNRLTEADLKVIERLTEAIINGGGSPDTYWDRYPPIEVKAP